MNTGDDGRFGSDESVELGFRVPLDEQRDEVAQRPAFIPGVHITNDGRHS